MTNYTLPSATSSLTQELASAKEFKFKQIHELAELFGFETRNRYALTQMNNTPVAYAAEQQKGVIGFLLRQILGHWRRFEVHIFNSKREEALKLIHPFRWFFQRLEVYDPNGKKLGAIEQRFAFFTKSFDIEDSNGIVHFQVRSPFLKFWSFAITRHGSEVGRVQKKWSGLLTEAFTDKDNFRLTMTGQLQEIERLLVLAAAIFVDLQYFERKAKN